MDAAPAVEEVEDIPQEGTPEQMRLAAAAVVSLLAALGGGAGGERFHRAVDEAGATTPAELPPQEEPE